MWLKSELYVKVLFVALVGKTVALIWYVSPIATVALALTDIPVTSTGFGASLLEGLSIGFTLLDGVSAGLVLDGASANFSHLASKTIFLVILVLKLYVLPFKYQPENL